MIGRGVYSAAKKEKLREKHNAKMLTLRHNLDPYFQESRIVDWTGTYFDFENWNDRREEEGMLCRKDSDCDWIGWMLSCKPYVLDFTPNRRWYGGHVSQIKGQCECRLTFMTFDNEDLGCKWKRNE